MGVGLCIGIARLSIESDSLTLCSAGVGDAPG